jgi:diguanylate cyclase (GGDEF)-like protein
MAPPPGWVPPRGSRGRPIPKEGSKTETEVFSPAAWPEAQKLDREQGLELVARCLAERLGADVASISVPGDGSRLGRVQAGAGPQVVPWDGGRLARRVLESEGTVVERFPERGGPGDLACVVAAPIRMPHGVAGAVCAGFKTSPSLSSDALSWLVESHASLAALCLEEPAGFRRLLASAYVDGLTGCLNYTRIREALGEEINRCRRHGRELACCFIDLDDFKRVNDLYGHPGGNRILKVVGRALTAGVRSSDHVGRYGGDEFVVVLPEAGAKHAAWLGRRLRSRIEHHTEDLVGERVTASIGVCQWHPDWSADELLGRADDALARAKHAGTPVAVADLA